MPAPVARQSSPALPPRPGSRVAILAGGGKLPLMIAGSARERGAEVMIVGIDGEADRQIERFPHVWVNWGHAGRMMRALRGDRPPSPDNTMVIAGAVSRPDLTSIRPDLGLLKLLPQALRLIGAGGDDALLTRVIRIFEGEGLHVSAVDTVAPELLIGNGRIGSVEIAAPAAADIALAQTVLTELGGLDVGQGVVVADQKIVAIEGVEGTDRMLALAAVLRANASAFSGALVKQPKPGQELRIDLPTIGLKTIDGIAAARLAGVAVEGAHTLMLDRQEATAAADRLGLFICGLDATARPTTRSATSPSVPACSLRVVGRVRPSDVDLNDALIGLDAVDRMARFGSGEAAAVVRRHILAISAAEGALAMARRVNVMGQWGLQRLRQRRGAVTLRIDGHSDPARNAAIVEAAAAAGFSGVAVFGRDVDAPIVHSDVRAAADSRGLFVVELR